MTYLGEQLPFGSTANRAIPPAGSHLLLSDTTTAPGYFALYHLISAAILDKRKVGRVAVQCLLCGLTIRLCG